MNTDENIYENIEEARTNGTTSREFITREIQNHYDVPRSLKVAANGDHAHNLTHPNKTEVGADQNYTAESSDANNEAIYSHISSDPLEISDSRVAETLEVSRESTKYSEISCESVISREVIRNTTKSCEVSSESTKSSEVSYESVKRSEVSDESLKSPEHSHRTAQSPDISHKSADSTDVSYENIECPELNNRKFEITIESPEVSKDSSIKSPALTPENLENPDFSDGVVSPVADYENISSPDVNVENVHTKPSIPDLTLPVTCFTDYSEPEPDLHEIKSVKDRMFLSTDDTSCLLFTQTVTSPMLTPSEENIDFLKGM